MSRPLIGVDMLYYAPVLTDTSSGATYDTPVRLENLVSITVTPNTEIATFFADDGPREAYSQIGEVDVAIQLPDIAAADYAYLIGANYNSGTGSMYYTTADTAPEVAIGFRAQKSDGTYRYIWLMKGKFGVANMEHQTKEGSVNFQTMTLNGKFLSRIYDNMVFRRIDENDPNFTFAGLPGTWFTSPDLGAAPSALTVASVTPLALATNVAVDTDVTVEFSAAFRAVDATITNFTLYNATDAAFVACTVYVDPLDATQVIMTPGADLANNKLHVVNVERGVRSAAGGALATQFVSTFTTVA